MKVHVEDELASIPVAVDYQAVPAFGVTAFPRHFRRCDEKMTHVRRIGSSDLIDRLNVLQRDEQQMGGSLGMDVLEREAVFVPVNHFRWDLSVSDFAKQTVNHSGSSETLAKRASLRSSPPMVRSMGGKSG
jgi:hypothetical protein